MKPVAGIKQAAHGAWPQILSSLGVSVPATGRQGPCPVCGGKDRFHFINDHGGGEWHCRRCDEPAHGDGLDLLMRVKGVSVMEAAGLVAGVLGTASLPDKFTDAGNTAREPLHQQDDTARRVAFSGRYARLSARSTPGKSRYLCEKGLGAFIFPVLPDGCLLLPLVDASGAIVAAQTISAQGVKRLLSGSVKRDAYHAVNAPDGVLTVIIVEGLANALSVHLMQPDALTVTAVDAGNLVHVAGGMRRKYPDAEIIIAADNDFHQPGERDASGRPKTNAGKLAAEKAAAAVGAG